MNHLNPTYLFKKSIFSVSLLIFFSHALYSQTTSQVSSKKEIKKNSQEAPISERYSLLGLVGSEQNGAAIIFDQEKKKNYVVEVGKALPSDKALTLDSVQDQKVMLVDKRGKKQLVEKDPWMESTGSSSSRYARGRPNSNYRRDVTPSYDGTYAENNEAYDASRKAARANQARRNYDKINGRYNRSPNRYNGDYQPGSGNTQDYNYNDTTNRYDQAYDYNNGNQHNRDKIAGRQDLRQRYQNNRRYNREVQDIEKQIENYRSENPEYDDEEMKEFLEEVRRQRRMRYQQDN